MRRARARCARLRVAHRSRTPINECVRRNGGEGDFAILESSYAQEKGRASEMEREREREREREGGRERKGGRREREGEASP